MKTYLPPIAKLSTVILPLIFLSACSASSPENTRNMTEALGSLCGKTFSGTVISQDPQDADWRKEVLKVGPVRCDTPNLIEMPLAVGENTSRTWFLSGRETTLELRHQHLLADGSLDPVTNYGGVVTQVPKFTDRVWRAEFPADALTVSVFKEHGLDPSITNVWALEYVAETTLTYELTRENRDFRAVFDLTNPL